MKHIHVIITIAIIFVVNLLPIRVFAQKTTIPEQVAEVFPSASSLSEQGVWSRVLDAKGTLLGYVAYSKPASDGIQGFNGETPLMVVFDAKKVIIKVYLLNNDETPGFVRRVEEGGLFDAWNGMTIDKALEAKVDAVSGATFTSNGVKQSLQACLQNIKKNVPADDENSTLSCQTTWYVIGAIALLLVLICVVAVNVRKRRK